MLGADLPMKAYKVDSRAICSRGHSADAKEGINSFLEKRPPAFSATVSRRCRTSCPGGSRVLISKLQTARMPSRRAASARPAL